MGSLTRIKRVVNLKSAIRKKLLVYFLISTVLVNFISLFTFNNSRIITSKINSIFLSDITLSNLGDGLDSVEDSLKTYLTTSHSEDLKNYLDRSNRLRNQSDSLKARLTDDPGSLILLDIKNMISTYLNETDSAMTEKRGRDIAAYSNDFNSASTIYADINSYIDNLKLYEFQENNVNYLSLNRSISLMEMLNIIVIVSAMLINILLIFWFSYKITEPIIRLSNSAAEIADGNYDIPEIVVRTDDEVNELADTFNRMVHSIRNQIQEIKKNAGIENRLQQQEMQNLKMKSLLDETQLQAMQAQINPHYMFNTLNAGMQIAMFEGAERTQVFLENLSKTLRYTLGNINAPVTLREEIENIESYIYLLKQRFGDKITYKQQIADDALLYVSMPRMILQPIVENAFIHGIGENENGGVIGLSVSRAENFVLIEIVDNGPGMLPETIAGILSQARGSSSGLSDGNAQAGKSIGLGNVIGRLMLSFHQHQPEDVIAIRSERHIGTKITLRLPIPNAEGKHV